jgi:NAD(P)-dependent dehydrogenase (short-subunit alcohol dehydrogenase family)
MKEIQAPPQLPGWVSTSEDQVRFARWSGDSNPMHLDGRVARRMPGGLPVVHGLHTVLKCFEALASLPERPDHVRGVKVRFLRPVLVGDRVDLRVIGGRSDELQVQADVDGLTVAVLKLAVGVPADAPAGQVGEATQGGTTGGDGPREIRMDEMIGRAGVVPFSAPAQTFAEAFPQAASWLGADRLRGLACLSRLVGMECPGLHSLLVGLSVEFVVTGASSAPLAYSVQTVDDRFRRVQIKVTGAGLNGVVDAAVRMPPTRQASMTEIGGRVDAKAFSGQVALIVGGSRGLGEVAAKLIAAGGGHPIITFAVGAGEASSVAAEIRAVGGRCDVVRYDVHAPAEPQLRRLGATPSSLYYFATPPIFRRKSRLFEPDVFREFLTFYVYGFESVCTALLAQTAGGLSVFYPSSTAVDERLKDLTEYAMAKAAGEMLCAQLARFTPRLRLMTQRLPRIATDQTATVVQEGAADAVDVLLPIVQATQSARTHSSE